jgi:predicted dehydrogenase
MKEINIGLIGFGFIGKVHTIAYRNLPLCFEKPLVRPHLTALLRSGKNPDGSGLPEELFDFVTTASPEFFSQKIDLVDICTPNFLHADQVHAAIEAKLPVYCEKPLADTLETARELTELAEKEGIMTHMAFICRYYRAIRQMKAIINAGLIGEPIHFRAQKYHESYLDPARPMSWRLRRSQSGGGAMMDLGIHMIDLVHYLLGNVVSVRAEMQTVIDQRPSTKGSGKMERVDVDGWAQCNLNLESGCTGSIEVTRMVAGAGESDMFEIYGTHGTVAYRYSSPEAALFYDLKKKQWVKGALELPPVEGERPLSQIWPPNKFSQGEMTNRHLASIYDFLLDLVECTPSAMDFRAGLRAQEVAAAAYLSAERNGDRIRLPL